MYGRYNNRNNLHGKKCKGRTQGQRVVRGVENWQISPLGAVLAISFGKCAIFP